jgi:alpha-beta hydrolase superfamily lysophospholipase
MLITTLIIMILATDIPKEVSFPTMDGGIVYADIYGTGDRAVVLAHGMKFDKGSWKQQAVQLAAGGFRVAAIDFRGYGKSHGGPNSKAPREEMYLDVLAAATYLRGHGAKSVAVLGASMGGGASAAAVAEGPHGAIDRLILLAGVPNAHPERLMVPKLFIVAEGDSLSTQIHEQFDKAPQPKELIVLDGDAHAQFLFTTKHADRVIGEILRFLNGM